MTDARPKDPMPPLQARAPRPAAVRLRRGAVAAALLGASGLLAGALAWAFVVQPELRAQARPRPAPPAETQGTVRPTELVAGRSADYAALTALPEPRRPWGDPELRPPRDAPAEPAAPAKAARASAIRGDGAAEARASGLFFPGRAAAGAPPASATGRTAGPAEDPAYNPHRLRAPLSPWEVKAGSIVPAALLTAVDTARAGPVVAVVTQDVYDTVSGRTLLIPQGARLIGRHDGESRHGDRRAFLAWDRLILPDGRSLTLTGAPGVDPQGAMGVAGRVDRRLGALLTATLFAGAVTALGQAAQDADGESGGWLGDVGDAAAIEAAQVGGKLIDRELAVRPTIRLRPGARVQVLVTRDLVLEPYPR